jgi:hypothetical protein
LAFLLAIAVVSLLPLSAKPTENKVHIPGVSHKRS